MNRRDVTKAILALPFAGWVSTLLPDPDAGGLVKRIIETKPELKPRRPGIQATDVTMYINGRAVKIVPNSLEFSVGGDDEYPIRRDLAEEIDQAIVDISGSSGGVIDGPYGIDKKALS